MTTHTGQEVPVTDPASWPTWLPACLHWLMLQNCCCNSVYIAFAGYWTGNGKCHAKYQNATVHTDGWEINEYFLRSVIFRFSIETINYSGRYQFDVIILIFFLLQSDTVLSKLTTSLWKQYLNKQQNILIQQLNNISNTLQKEKKKVMEISEHSNNNINTVGYWTKQTVTLWVCAPPKSLCVCVCVALCNGSGPVLVTLILC